MYTPIPSLNHDTPTSTRWPPTCDLMAVGKYSGERIQGMGPVPRLCPRAASIRHARGTQLQEVSDGLEGGGTLVCGKGGCGGGGVDEN